MCILQYVVSFVAMATISRVASSLDTLHISSARPRGRRFLFTQNSYSMCTMFCPLVCPQGYVLSANGCLLCQCTTITSVTTTSSFQRSSVQTVLQPFSPINGGIFLSKPCNPAVRHCRRQCTLGYLQGGNGCQYCICQSTIASHVTTPVTPVPSTTGHQVTTSENVTVSPLTTRTRPTLSPLSIRTRPTLSPLTTRTRPTQSPLITRPRVTLSPLTRPGVTTTTVTTTIKPISARVTTRMSTSPTTNYNDPCIPSQKTCDKPCGGSYVKGPGWCQYCLCAKKNVQKIQTTTIAPGAMTGKFATVPHYLDLSPTSEACIIAKVICNQKCDHGFVSHPNDCLYCSCRKQADVPANDDPDAFFVTLPNPCVKQTPTCGIMCLNGYVMGPRNCEFCSCRN
ncbi:uncharacterized protein LOC123542147 isoform X2 [Mercenaria mercenaria]|uniref:uncharacterized protein LOC123542147 isoform X2 n=1 Tax=Mercenaria mercenaria TaxID=6596 RepID=UPI00234E423D|nr:uncharacterized protein LOC123542147 isoform X2 [Mercenaria mercenaria]